MIQIVAHRGWSGKAPENTLAAFELALADPQIDWIEFDVNLSKDGVPVVIHDHTLERTTDGSGLVKDYTFEELRRLDAGSWFAPDFREERIPSLEEVLRLAKGRCKLIVELKSMGALYEGEGMEEKVISLIQRYDMKEQIELISFNHDSIVRVHEIDPSIPTGLIFLGKPTLLMEQLHYTGASSISMYHAFVTPALVNQMAAAGIDFGAWTIDDPELLARLVEAYPDLRITTNHPDRLIRKRDAICK